MLNLTPTEVDLLRDYLEEIDAIIDADDGTLVPLPLLRKHDEVKEIFYALENG